jgi:hypothetical protein
MKNFVLSLCKAFSKCFCYLGWCSALHLKLYFFKSNKVKALKHVFIHHYTHKCFVLCKISPSCSRPS